MSCRIEEYTGPPTYVFWYRNVEVINYSERKSILIRIANVQQRAFKSDDEPQFKRKLKLSTTEKKANQSYTPTPTFMLSNTFHHTKNTPEKSVQITKVCGIS